MKFNKTKFAGVYILDMEQHTDKRGYFGRIFCQNEFKKQGIDFKICQSSLSYNQKRGTLRGMHYQTKPYSEKKIVQCVNGAIYDVIIDLRQKSKTYLKWFSVVLTQENGKILFIPEGLAHGFQTLQNNSLVLYQISKEYQPSYQRGIRWNDNAFNIKWPKTKKVTISEKDKSYADYYK